MDRPHSVHIRLHYGGSTPINRPGATITHSAPHRTPSPEEALLAALLDAANAIPASSVLAEVLDAATERLDASFRPSALAVLLADEASGRWLTSRRRGVALPLLHATADLPPVLAQVARRAAATTLAAGSPGLRATARSGLYAPLLAGPVLVGVVAVEGDQADAFGAGDVRLLEGLARSTATGLANARASERRQRDEVAAERARVAGSLHDGVVQSLASLGLQLDRLSRHRPGDDLGPGLDRVRADVRAAMGELRATLAELRTDVTADRGLDQVLASHLARVASRTGADVRLEVSGGPVRLPLPEEGALWRIARQAVEDAVRSRLAGPITVRWHSDGQRAELEVAVGGSEDAAALGAGTGELASLHRRAAAIGASIEVGAAPGRGTVLRCALG
jgi:signal transduction histidine kinase